MGCCLCPRLLIAQPYLLLWVGAEVAPPMPHWSQENISSKQQFLIGWHCLPQQFLVAQEVLNYVLLQEMLLWLHGPQHLHRGGPAIPATVDL